MPTYQHGRHEHGQNFLTDPSTIATVTRLVAATKGPIIEIGPGDGALTTPLAGLNRPVTAVEIDTRLARRLTQRLPPHVEVVADDFLTYRLPTSAHVLVGNLPFHQTTAMLRRILHAPAWTVVQWEVARRRAGVGGATMMTAQWAPWFDFSLHGRVPARAFTPRPGVDGGILTIHRRKHPLLPQAQRRQFHALVHRISTGPGRGLAQILARITSLGSPQAAQAWLTRHGVTPDGLPKDMPVEAWADLFKTTGSSPPAHRAQTQQPNSLATGSALLVLLEPDGSGVGFPGRQEGRQEAREARFKVISTQVDVAACAFVASLGDAGAAEGLHMVAQGRLGHGGIQLPPLPLLAIREEVDDAEAKWVRQCRQDAGQRQVLHGGMLGVGMLVGHAPTLPCSPEVELLLPCSLFVEHRTFLVGRSGGTMSRSWLWLATLFIAMLALGTDEFVIAGVFNRVANDLEVSSGAAEQLGHGVRAGIRPWGPCAGCVAGALPAPPRACRGGSWCSWQQTWDVLSRPVCRCCWYCEWWLD